MGETLTQGGKQKTAHISLWPPHTNTPPQAHHTHTETKSGPFLWEMLGEYSHLLTTWQENNIKGLGDLRTAGEVRADGRGVHGPEGEH